MSYNLTEEGEGEWGEGGGERGEERKRDRERDI